MLDQSSAEQLLRQRLEALEMEREALRRENQILRVELHTLWAKYSPARTVSR